MNGVAKRFWTEMLNVRIPLEETRTRRPKRQKLMRKLATGQASRAAA